MSVCVSILCLQRRRPVCKKMMVSPSDSLPFFLRSSLSITGALLLNISRSLVSAVSFPAGLDRARPPNALWCILSWKSCFCLLKLLRIRLNLVVSYHYETSRWSNLGISGHCTTGSPPSCLLRLNEESYRKFENKCLYNQSTVINNHLNANIKNKTVKTTISKPMHCPLLEHGPSPLAKKLSQVYTFNR